MATDTEALGKTVLWAIEDYALPAMLRQLVH